MRRRQGSGISMLSAMSVEGASNVSPLWHNFQGRIKRTSKDVVDSFKIDQDSIKTKVNYFTENFLREIITNL
jgi:hypothetical protein